MNDEEKVTKAKINLREGIFEFEGSETFVKEYVKEFRDLFTKQKIIPDALLEDKSKGFVPQNNNNPPKQKVGFKGVNVPPLPVELKNNQPSLREFFNQKRPSATNNQEITTCFVYYLNKIAKIPEVMPGHVVSCYNEMSIKKPLNLPQLFRDISHLKAWVEPAKTSGSVRITISGENLVEHDLPVIKK
jgi:hypothetical protein